MQTIRMSSASARPLRSASGAGGSGARAQRPGRKKPTRRRAGRRADPTSGQHDQRSAPANTIGRPTSASAKTTAAAGCRGSRRRHAPAQPAHLLRRLRHEALQRRSATLLASSTIGVDRMRAGASGVLAGELRQPAPLGAIRRPQTRRRRRSRRATASEHADEREETSSAWLQYSMFTSLRMMSVPVVCSDDRNDDQPTPERIVARAATGGPGQHEAQRQRGRRQRIRTQPVMRPCAEMTRICRFTLNRSRITGRGCRAPPPGCRRTHAGSAPR